MPPNRGPKRPGRGPTGFLPFVNGQRFDPADGFPYPRTEPDFARTREFRAGALLPAVTAPPTQFNRAVRFNGADASGLERTSALPGPANWSIGVFFYVPALPSVNGVIWMLQDTTTGTAPTNYQDIEIDNLGAVSFSSPAASVNLFTASVGTWYFVLVALGSGSGNAYWGQFGKALSSTSLPSVTTAFTPADLTLATDNFTGGAGDNPLNGRLTGAKVWSVALTSGEASTEATRVDAAKTASLHAAWLLNSSANKLVDSSGFGRNLSARGAGTWVDEEGPFISPGPFDGQFFPKTLNVDVAARAAPPRLVELATFVPVLSTAFNPANGFPWPPYVDVVRALVRQPSEVLAFVGPGPSVAPALSWAPSFPDSAPRRWPARETLQTFLPPPPGGYVPIGGWWPLFPDSAPALRPLVREGWESFVPAPVGGFAPLGSWYPTFPDSAPRALGRLGGDAWGGYVAQPTGGFAPLLSWAPSFPHEARAALRYRETLTAFVPVVAGQALPPLTWQPSFPDSAPRAPQTAWREGVEAFVNTFPAIVVPRGWYPNFPDVAPGRALAREGWQSFEPLPLPSGLLTWSPSLPDRATAARRALEGLTSVEPLPLPSGMLAWSPQLAQPLRVELRRAGLEQVAPLKQQTSPVVLAYGDQTGPLPRRAFARLSEFSVYAPIGWVVPLEVHRVGAVAWVLIQAPGVAGEVLSVGAVAQRVVTVPGVAGLVDTVGAQTLAPVVVGVAGRIVTVPGVAVVTITTQGIL